MARSRLAATYGGCQPNASTGASSAGEVKPQRTLASGGDEACRVDRCLACCADRGLHERSLDPGTSEGNRRFRGELGRQHRTWVAGPDGDLIAVDADNRRRRLRWSSGRPRLERGQQHCSSVGICGGDLGVDALACRAGRRRHRVTRPARRGSPRLPIVDAAGEHVVPEHHPLRARRRRRRRRCTRTRARSNAVIVQRCRLLQRCRGSPDR